ncbi:aminoglycoside N(3)-acetyltransferase [uncultured Lactobacillus sp.]|uniref:aminoglycoside N(3)-acetyltransferase n=1 Tax=uncultured Lactobacillus sp. TaxID=153152 RepID=UPI00260C5C41|nr:AAC(3) family N-acetyltransferase [uncultured Lactobacillus sp.]
MSEKLITNVITKSDLKNALHQLNVTKNDVCLVHTSMSKFQFLPGASQTIVQALKETLASGTLMMPSQVSTNCDPATWEYPPVRQDLIQTIRDSMPPYDPVTSPTEGLGLTPEYFRALPDVFRSTHPYLPIAIWGKNAKQIAAKQPLNLPYGINSPLDYIYQHYGKTIFLGTDYETCTMLHYAESTIHRKKQTYSAATGIDESGKTIWTEYQNVDLDSYDDFSELGRTFEKMFPNAFQSITLGHGIIKVINTRPLVEFAQDWFDKKDHQFGNCM